MEILAGIALILLIYVELAASWLLFFGAMMLRFFIRSVISGSKDKN